MQIDTFLYINGIEVVNKIKKNIRKGVNALRGYFGPPMRSKNKSGSTQVSSYYFVRTIAKV